MGVNQLMVHHVEFYDFFFRIFVAIGCGFLIGFERQWINRVAGIQTNVLVCSGSCIFILGSFFITYEGQSASRIAAQIVSGIGFLGAGMIFKDGFSAHGINTAATIWAAAAIGILCGLGLVPHAIGVVAILVLANMVFRKLDTLISKNRKSLDLRLVRNYEIQVMAPRENSVELRDKIIDNINVDDHHIFAVKTGFAKNNQVKITVSFTTHHMDYTRIQKVSKNIEKLQENLIVDWSQIRD